MSSAHFPRYSDEASEAASSLREAVPLMTKYKISVTPDNYTLWYEYTLKRNSELNKRMDEMIASSAAFTPEAVNKLLKEYVLPTRSSVTGMPEALRSLTKILDRAEEGLNAAGGDALGLAQDIAPLLAELDEESSPDAVERVGKTLYSAVEKIYLAAEEFHQKAEKSKSEITELKKEVAQATKEAVTDPLTKLFNRRKLDKTLKQAIDDRENNESAQLYVMMLDIDHFKSFNDEYGHQVGDQVLVYTASLLKKSIPSQFVARYGGEEFAVITKGIDQAATFNLAEDYRKALAAAKLVKRGTQEPIRAITTSVGITAYQAGDDAASIIERADEALYDAKSLGRNCTIMSS